MPFPLFPFGINSQKSACGGPAIRCSHSHKVSILYHNYTGNALCFCHVCFNKFRFIGRGPQYFSVSIPFNFISETYICLPEIKSF